MVFLKMMVLFVLIKQHIVQTDEKWRTHNKTKQYIFPLCGSLWSDNLGLLLIYVRALDVKRHRVTEETEWMNKGQTDLSRY